MIHTLRGTLAEKHDDSFVIECGGVGFKALANPRTLRSLPSIGDTVRVFCRLFIRDEDPILFGFHAEEELKFFEMLNTVSGVGPKTALGILDIDRVPNIMAAVMEKRVDILTHASGIGKKTAERIILELHAKIALITPHNLTAETDVNREVEEVLTGLGYARHEVRGVLSPMEGKEPVEDRLRRALKALGRSK